MAIIPNMKPREVLTKHSTFSFPHLRDGMWEVLKELLLGCNNYSFGAEGGKGTEMILKKKKKRRNLSQIQSNLKNL